MTRVHKYIAFLLATLTISLSACAGPTHQEPPSFDADNSALTWNNTSSFDNFFPLLEERYPDIKINPSSYAGANRTGYTWAQMRADDITDVLAISVILDEELTSERLIDLSGYGFVDNLSTAVLDQVAIDGGIYLLPVSTTFYGIYYNKTLMEEHGWELPANYGELAALCAEIEDTGLLPGVISTQLTGNTFSAVFNLAKTDWLTTPEGIRWEQDFLAGNASAAGHWENTMQLAQRYLDIGMFHTDPEDRDMNTVFQEYVEGRKCVFLTQAGGVKTQQLDNGDELGMMPYIGADGSKNIYMYNPTTYIGLSKRLLEPGNEEKLSSALKMLELMFSDEGQAAFITGSSPCVLGVLNNNNMPEDAFAYDAQEAMREGRAFPMTYAHWENVLSDMGQAFKDWFRGVEGTDGAWAIERMDELQTGYLHNADEVYFCESKADFTVEQTAALVGKALGSNVGVDAVMVAVGSERDSGVTVGAGITGKLYKEHINADVANSVMPYYDGEYAVMTMTGAQAKQMQSAGLPVEGDAVPFEYLLVTKGNQELADDQTYRVAFLMNGYTEEMAEAYSVQVEKASIRAIFREWLAEQRTVSPDGNPWN